MVRLGRSGRTSTVHLSVWLHTSGSTQVQVRTNMHTHTTHTCTHAQLDKLYVIKFGEVQLYKGNVLGQAGTLTHTCTHTHARTHARTQLDRDDVLVQARTHTHTHTHTQHTCTHTQLDKLYVIKFGEVQLYKDDVLVQAGTLLHTHTHTNTHTHTHAAGQG